MDSLPSAGLKRCTRSFGMRQDVPQEDNGPGHVPCITQGALLQSTLVGLGSSGFDTLNAVDVGGRGPSLLLPLVLSRKPQHFEPRLRVPLMAWPVLPGQLLCRLLQWERDSES